MFAVCSFRFCGGWSLITFAFGDGCCGLDQEVCSCRHARWWRLRLLCLPAQLGMQVVDFSDKGEFQLRQLVDRCPWRMIWCSECVTQCNYVMTPGGCLGEMPFTGRRAECAGERAKELFRTDSTRGRAKELFRAECGGGCVSQCL